MVQLLRSFTNTIYNSQVVMAVARLLFYLGPQSARAKIVNPLLRLLHNSKEVESVVLSYHVVITHELPVSLLI